MPNEDGLNPGADDGTLNKDGNGDAAGNADDKDKKPVDKDKGGDAGGEPKLSLTQAELDALISKRVNRATKDAADKAKLSETELLKKERDEAKAEVRDRDSKDNFAIASGLDLGKATRLFAMYKDDIEYDDAGKATNMKDVVATAKKEWPELFGKRKVEGSADGGSGSGEGQGAGGGMNSILRSMAKRGQGSA